MKMSNLNLFKSAGSPRSKRSPQIASVINEAGGRAYSHTDKEQLAQLVMSGFLGDTFYVKAESQLDDIIRLAVNVDNHFIAQLALEARRNGFMKDTPALLCAILTTRGDQGILWLRRIFSRVIDNGKMLRNFVQIIRSGKVGRKSFGSAPKSLIRKWFLDHDDDDIFRAIVGNDPTLSDIIKMVHPHPRTLKQSALFAHILGKEIKDKRHLPDLVKKWERVKSADFTNALPDVPFEMLSSLPLNEEGWKRVAVGMTWFQLRMNINTLQRHGVFADRKMVTDIAARLRDPDTIRRTKVFPYQILTSIFYLDDAVPHDIRDALQDALDVSLENVPDLMHLSTHVFVDVSGSMRDPITGARQDGKRMVPASKIRCVDVAALFAAALIKKGARARLFNNEVVPCTLNRRDSTLTITKQIAAKLNGGTAVSAPLVDLNRQGEHADLIFVISDNESWADPGYTGSNRNQQQTQLMVEFDRLKLANPRAKMVLLDLTPGNSKQAKSRADILAIGGFSDRVFDIVDDFVHARGSKSFWVDQIEKVSI